MATKSEPTPESLRFKAKQIKDKANKVQYNPKRYIELMKQVWALNIQAANLEEQKQS